MPTRPVTALIVAFWLAVFKETDPSKIVVGFGGTVNMVTGLCFVIGIVGLMVVPFHVAQLAEGIRNQRDAPISPWVFAGLPVGLLAGVLAVILPLRAGGRSLNRIEF